jgi:hypothetical protein
VLDVTDGNVTSAYGDFKIVEKVPGPAEFERIDIGGTNASYLGIHRLENGEYQRTCIYQNPSEAKVTEVSGLATNATLHDLTYDVKQDGNYLLVITGGNLDAIIKEPM